MIATSKDHSRPTLDQVSTGRLVGSEGDSQSYWERLPAEILTDIFLLCRPLKEDLPPSNVHAPYLLTYVCRAWYKMVTDIPKMWSTVVLTTTNVTDPIRPSQLVAGAQYLGMCTARAKATLLDLYIRTEFIAHPTSLECVQRAGLQRLILVYPPSPFDLLPPVFPLPFWITMPKLLTLEVHSQSNIASSDLVVLDEIMNSAQTLKRHVSLRPGLIGILSPPIIKDMSNLQVLTLQQPIPVSICPLILQRAPLLQKLSLAVGISFENDLMYKSMLELLRTSTTGGTARPFFHSHLQYLALAHSESNLSSLFSSVTLPLLQFLVIDFRARAPMIQALWPHDSFIDFLERSNCKLKGFHILDQPISSPQFLDLLHLPYLADSLEYLGIQHYTGETQIINDDVLEQLTLPQPMPQEAVPTPWPSFKVPHTTEPRSGLCPNIERFLLYIPVKGFTPSKLVTMFASRLPLNAHPTLPSKPLRHVEIDLYDGMMVDLRSLRERGLVLTIFEPSESDPIPLDAEQQKLWGYHLSEGLDDEVYDHATGTWRTSDVTLAML